jgi:hypothetical protein
METMAPNTKRVCAVIIYLFLAACGHPSDESLRVRFLQREASFDKLLRMAREDSQMSHIAPAFTWPTNKEVPFPTQRWDEYRRLFRELGIEDGIQRLDNDRGLILIVRSTGMLGRGTAKGYAYSTKQLEPVVDSLDTAIPQPCAGQKHCIAFKRLKNNSYLSYEI